MSQILSTQFQLKPESASRLANFCGYLNEHLQQVEKRLGVQIHHRGFSFEVSGSKNSIKSAQALLMQMYQTTRDKAIQPEDIHLLLQKSNIEQMEDNSQKSVVIKTRKTCLQTKGVNQANYVKSLKEQDLTFGIGPAGTGKTFLAVAAAVEALENDEVQRLILVRPAVEAGEKLGFLPGDLVQKVDPYLRPIYDALYETLGFEKVEKLIERNIIEIAPLAFMRGRTLNHAYIILDEAQNTTVEQMKMFLTRIGFGSHAVVTGDPSQVDLPRHITSGLIQVQEVLKNVKGCSFTYFSSKDVIRHPMVQRIVVAYEHYEKQSQSSD